MWLLLVAAFLALVVASIAHTLHTVATCDATVVRGLLWMECLEEARRG
jgi:hypothetical protein